MTDQTAEADDAKDKERKGEQPHPSKAEAKRREQSGKTFQQTGMEVHK